MDGVCIYVCMSVWDVCRGEFFECILCSPCASFVVIGLSTTHMCGNPTTSLRYLPPNISVKLHLVRFVLVLRLT